jgi:4-amino-4-deoxy-L-arabinose transferase-like glycosyltransferase
MVRLPCFRDNALDRFLRLQTEPAQGADVATARVSVARRIALHLPPVALLLLMLVTKANSLNTPLHWDELVYLMPSRALADGSLFGVLPGYHAPGAFLGHPPALYLLYGAQYKLFGDTLWIPHTIALAFALLAVWLTYHLGCHLFDAVTAVLAATLLFFSPLFFAQAPMALGDVPITALGIMTLSCVLRGNYLAYLISASCLVMAKETAVGVIVAIILFVVLDPRTSRLRWKEGLKYAIPLIPIGLFFVAERLATGTFVSNPYFENRALLSFDPTSRSSIIDEGLPKIAEVAQWIFVRQGSKYLILSIFLAILIEGRAMWRREFIPFLLIIAGFWSAFSLVFYLPRYTLVTLPYLCLISAWSMGRIVRGSVPKQILLAALVVAGSVGTYHGYSTSKGSYEESMQYLDVVHVYREACQYIEANFVNKTVLASNPAVAYLQHPYLGYVDHPAYQVVWPSSASVPSNREYDVAVYSVQGDERQTLILKYVKEKNYVLLQRFARGGKAVELYVPREVR